MRRAATACLLVLALAGAATEAGAVPYTFTTVNAPNTGDPPYMGIVITDSMDTSITGINI